DPSIMPVVRGDAVAILCMSDDRPLSCDIRVLLKGNLPVIGIESFVAPFAHKAGQGRQAVSAAECLDVPVENDLSRRSRRRPAVDLDFIRIVRRRLAVLFEQTRNNFWRGAAAMACIASHRFTPSK